MGYTTDFRGSFDVEPELAENHREYLLQFNETRRMRRNSELAEQLPDPLREKVGLPIGNEGGYFVGGDGNDYGQDRNSSIIDSNSPPHLQPGLWCQWIPSDEGSAIEWDQGEKFYNYIEWLQYLIDNFFKPWGYTLNGEVEWRGEEWDDSGVIIVMDDNKVIVHDRVINYEYPRQ